jgi:hypothetical protein
LPAESQLDAALAAKATESRTAGNRGWETTRMGPV